MSTKPLFTTIVLMLAVGLAAISQTPARSKHRAVMQMSEPQGDEWNYLLAHVQKHADRVRQRRRRRDRGGFLRPGTQHAAQDQRQSRGRFETVRGTGSEAGSLPQ